MRSAIEMPCLATELVEDGERAVAAVEAGQIARGPQRRRRPDAGGQRHDLIGDQVPLPTEHTTTGRPPLATGGDRVERRDGVELGEVEDVDVVQPRRTPVCHHRVGREDQPSRSRSEAEGVRRRRGDVHTVQDDPDPAGRDHLVQSVACDPRTASHRRGEGESVEEFDLGHRHRLGSLPPP